MNDGHPRDGSPPLGRRGSRPTTTRPTAPSGPGTPGRTGRVEARNGLVGRGPPEAFDFVVEDAGTDPTLGILAIYLGAAACQQSRSFAHDVDVDRVLVEAERPTTRSDGGTDSPGGDATNAEVSPRQVHAVVEVRNTIPSGVCGALGDRLGADRVPFSIVPDFVGVDVRVSPRAGSRRAVADD